MYLGKHKGEQWGFSYCIPSFVMYFLKSKIEANNKVVHITLVRKFLVGINKDGLSYSGPLEHSPLGGQKFSLANVPSLPQDLNSSRG